MSAESSANALTATSHELLSGQYVYVERNGHTEEEDPFDTVRDRFAVDYLAPNHDNPVLKAGRMAIAMFKNSNNRGANGRWMIRAADIGGNTGWYAKYLDSLCGTDIDIKTALIDPAAKHLQRGAFLVPWDSDERGITPMPHYADEVELGDGALDYAALHYMLYHVEDQAGLLERVAGWLKPNGWATFATSGERNKVFQHDVFEELVAHELEAIYNADQSPEVENVRVRCPPRFNPTFTLENAKDVIGKHFDVDDTLTIYQHGDVDFNHPERLKVFWKSVRSMRKAFSPIPSPQELKIATDRALVQLVLGKSAVEAGLDEKAITELLNDTSRWKHKIPLEHVARGVLFAVPRERRARDAAKVASPRDWDTAYEKELSPEPVGV